ncbi:hypothetical protein GIB67_029754 [Kingdonia uniflora]|uniref:X8 domain-containing protein n=1 Tax=Kingdonia uniflora TaxID=39325 RepID=A0A7J7L1S6_9MAGN|nr:hypothetical protein GIB67_016046 [Kingdonia uniflora]KAF6176700.1 hypothetical protein GIB67_029754 [Kingdonia uniflora]
MEPRRACISLSFIVLYLSIVATLFPQCVEARVAKKYLQVSNNAERSGIKTTMKLKDVKHIDAPSLDPLNTQPYVSSPFSLPPFDALSPVSQNTPGNCDDPSNTPSPPSIVIISYPPPPPPPPPSSLPPLSPILPIQSPPPSPTLVFPSPPESPPTYFPQPPESSPSPPQYGLTPPVYFPSPSVNLPSPSGVIPSPSIYFPSPSVNKPSPSGVLPSPSIYFPSPSLNNPSPPVFQPPVVYPPPLPRSPPRGSDLALWCVTKPSVPDPIVEEAMDYACGSGADCGSIQPAGSCYEPDTLFAHSSYAFNSYWQRTKAAGGTCDFGGTAILVTVDPSFNACQFIFA